MLKEGRFIKEEPPKIGRYYIPRYKEDEHTPEERFAQNLILGNADKKYSFFSKFLNVMLRV
jgi:hypothetical protein